MRTFVEGETESPETDEDLEEGLQGHFRAMHSVHRDMLAGLEQLLDLVQDLQHPVEIYGKKIDNSALPVAYCQRTGSQVSQAGTGFRVVLLGSLLQVVVH